MPSTRTSDQLSSMAIGQWSCARRHGRRCGLVGAQQLVGQVVGRQDGFDLHVGVGQQADQRSHLAGQRGAPDLDRPGQPHLQRPGRRRGRRCASPCRRAARRRRRCRPRPRRAPPRRRDTTASPRPSSGKDAATHCTRCTGEPSRASEASTEAQAPTRRSCSSAPSRAKLPPRSDSAAVSVRPARSCTTPMSCQPARRRRIPRQRPDAAGAAPETRSGAPPSTRRPAATRRRSGRPPAPSPARRRGRGCRRPPPRRPRWAPSAGRARRRRGPRPPS